MARRTLASCALALVACGRIGFDGRRGPEPGDGAADAEPPCNVASPFGAPTVVAGLEGAGYSAVARLSTDEREVFFQGLPGAFKQLYRATRATASGPFGAWELLALNDASTDNYDAMLDQAGLMLVFASPRSGGPGGIDLWRATRSDLTAGFGAASPIAAVDTGVNEDQPYLMGHDVALWYNSVAAGTEDLYEATWSGSDFVAGAPVGELDTGSAETFPTPSADGKVIYFGSDRGGNMDIWVATRPTGSGSFGSITRVAELASAQDDQPSWISPDLCRLYFTRGPLSSSAMVYVAERAP